MNENINLVEILKDAPKGTKLYSPVCGEVELISVSENGSPFSIVVGKKGCEEYVFTKEGKYFNTNAAECILFPSKDQRDWSKFETMKEKVKVTLYPFSRVLVRGTDDDIWCIDLFAYYDEDEAHKYVCIDCMWPYCIPYCKETAHLLGTTDECPIDYEIECSKEYKEEYPND